MRRLLIVEDQADIRKLIRMTLEFEQYEVHEAVDGPQALAMAGDLRPDIVVLDLMLPGGLDGLEVCRALRQQPDTAATRIVMLTARGQWQDRQQGLQAGAHEYLVKPFSPLRLIETLERLGSPA